MTDDTESVYRMGVRGGESYKPRQSVHINSMRLAQDLTAKLEPFYSKVERKMITDVFYRCIEDHLREKPKGNGR